VQPAADFDAEPTKDAAVATQPATTDDDADTAADSAPATPPTTEPEPAVNQPRTDNAVAAVTRAELNRVDALVMIAQAYLRGEKVNRSPIDVTVTIPMSALRKDAEADDIGFAGDTAIDVEAVRRLSCDAGVVEVTEDEHGTPLSVGRKRRTISGSIKRALLKRDSACTFPGCTNHVFLEGHHIRHWADGGATSLDNLVTLCSYHHRFVHEYGYAIELCSDGPQFRDPAGKLIVAVPERAVPADLGWPAIRAANAEMKIDASTPPCWDGTPMSYRRVIGHLAFADKLT
jgi:hypothetical protein